MSRNSYNHNIANQWHQKETKTGSKKPQTKEK